jgi:hypothetical protein
MPSLTIRHVTTYRYRQPVAFGEHRMMLRPRDSHDQRVIEASPEINPEPRSLRFVQDAFGNHVGIVVNHALLNAYSKLIVAAVNGDCIGGGFELLLSTDIRAAVPEARFGLPEGGDLSVWRPGTAPIRSRIAAHCAYGDCLRPKLRWRGWRRGVLPRALWPGASSAPR